MKKRDVADPWYTRNFDKTYDDICKGLNGFLLYLKKEKDNIEIIICIWGPAPKTQKVDWEESFAQSR